MANNTGILDSIAADTNFAILTSDAKMAATNKVITETLSDKVVTETKIDNSVIFIGKKYQDKKVETVIGLDVLTRSKSSVNSLL